MWLTFGIYPITTYFRVGELCCTGEFLSIQDNKVLFANFGYRIFLFTPMLSCETDFSLVKGHLARQFTILLSPNWFWYVTLFMSQLSTGIISERQKCQIEPCWPKVATYWSYDQWPDQRGKSWFFFSGKHFLYY